MIRSGVKKEYRIEIKSSLLNRILDDRRMQVILFWVILSLLISFSLIQHMLSDEYLCRRLGFDGYRRGFEDGKWMVLCFNNTSNGFGGNRSYIPLDDVR